jgi:hypothetical protein
MSEDKPTINLADAPIKLGGNGGKFSSKTVAASDLRSD